MRGKRTEETPFYIGWAGLPPALRGFVRGLALCLVLVAGGLGWLVAGAQRDPGTGRWGTDAPVTLTGWFVLAPYPALQVVEGPEELVGRTVLMMSQGKLGAEDRVAPLAGRLGVARGALISRGGLSLLELAAGEDAAVGIDWTEVPTYAIRGTAAPPAPPTLFSQTLGRRTLAGEIIDSKCALGVMKPGTGRAHKGCATLCILGGVPPMYLVRSEEGGFDAYVLTGPDGEALPREEILTYVADPVSVEGLLVETQGLVQFRIDPGGLGRL
ncbi:MAG: hypothetical protein HXY25_08330 [Alphaproteobacteria bacterium]|nr:hypothetical protein [Alphaproteobacteria bacterium]